MTHDAKTTLVSILTNLMITGYFAVRIFQMNAGGEFAGEDGLMVWARTVLWIIPISIVATIVMTIAFNIIFAIVTNNPKPSFVVDERDKFFSGKGMIATVVISSAGFMLATLALAFGWSALAAFNIIFFGFALADLGGSFLKMYLHRRGY